MERVTHYRPRIARETRLLVTTALLAVLALWMLARLRFPTPPAEPRAIAGILSTLGTGADFDGLATQVARVRAVVAPYLLTVEFDVPTSSAAPTVRSALRIGGDLAVVQVPPGGQLRSAAGATVVAQDTASNLAVLRLALDPETNPSAPRVTRLPQPPQYVVASAVYPDGVALRPVFVAAIAAVDAPLWSSMAWAVPPETGLTVGSFLFTRDGEFAGMTISHRGALAFVSGDTVLDEANRLITRTAVTSATYGIQVEDLSPALQRTLAATRGVVVTWVDPNGPARDTLVVGDVVEVAHGQAVPTVEHWRRHMAGLVAGSPVEVGIRRAGTLRSVKLTPDSANVDPSPTRAATVTFGARTRAVRGVGAEVTAVSAASLASRAGLVVGDFITFIGATSAPTPNQLAEITGALRAGQSVLLGVRRGDEHRLLVLER